MVSTDNTSVMAYIQAQGLSHSHSLYLETRNLLVLCKSLNIIFLVKTHTRSSQRPGGQFVSQTPVASVGLDTSSGSGQPDFSYVRLSTGQPVCDQRQPQTSSVRESSLRSSSVDGKRSFVRLRPTGCLCLSLTHSNSPNLGEIRVSFCQILVQRPSQSPVRLSQEISPQVRSQRGRLHADPDMFHDTSGL
ncbi:hypothetical protein DPMN_150464 [Dreissena polymorpha]|uniref:Uncharacterized protein n=1 Tax=Dreissena polymorpha TaxID=45954 RepID=A0A9D4FEM7_DREPO|nr:hypothetical protein DPMN_150464 [Dreissena polymorpha]